MQTTAGPTSWWSSSSFIPISPPATRPHVVENKTTPHTAKAQLKQNIVPQPTQQARTPTSTAPIAPLLARAASTTSAEDAPPPDSPTRGHQNSALRPRASVVLDRNAASLETDSIPTPQSCSNGPSNTRRSLALLRHRAWPDLSHGNSHPAHAVSDCGSELVLQSLYRLPELARPFRAHLLK